MRVLFLDVDAEYLNPTRSLVRGIASRLGTVVFFGPGYVSSEILHEGLELFTKKKVQAHIGIHIDIHIHLHI